MSTYITLLDCNHQQSAEYIGGNLDSNALFTNKLGEGVKVNAGDKISVHNCFISETGSDDNAIQINNSFVGDKTITFTQQTPINYINGSNDKIWGYERITASNVSQSVETYNNKSTILYNYYITNHGEIAYSLPRRFINKESTPDWNASRDALSEGMMNGPYALLTSIGNLQNGGDLNSYYCDDDAFYFQIGDISASLTSAADRNRIKPIHNNSRFKIFTQTETRYGTQTDSASIPSILNASLTSPSDLEYIEYIEKLELEIPTGFKSPESIADSITNQLTKQSQPQINTIRSTADFSAGVDAVTNRPLNLEINSPTYHTFNAGSVETNSAATYDAFDVATEDSERGLQYLSSYQYIGIKRPDLWIKGREFNVEYQNYRNGVTPGIAPYVSYANFDLAHTLTDDQFTRDTLPNEPRKHTIVTELLWDENGKIHMRKLHEIFKQQKNHPELFENKYNILKDYTTINNSRFLHLNILRSSVRLSTTDGTHKNQLGCDYYKSTTTGSTLLNSVPLFFDFNPLYENIESEGESWEDGYSYGVFFKYQEEGAIDKVAFTTSHLGIIENASLSADTTTIPNHLFKLNDGTGTGDEINFNTKMGWDSHFTSYGNVVMGLTNGWGQRPRNVGDALIEQLNTAYADEFGSFGYLQKVYLGANEPLIEYNTTSNRFEISQLHTAERVQNRYNAGATTGTGDAATSVQEFATAGNKVYKINKRLFDNSWNPDILPYGANNKTLTVNSQEYNFDFLNPNLQGWKIYDQLSGIIIKDFGYTESQWTKGFWNTLGFDYIQFNSPETSANDLTTRIGNDNKNNLPYAMTNADVGQTATMDFNTNVFGAGMYNLQVPSVQSLNVTNTGTNQSIYHRIDQKYEMYPSITESASSVKLTAPRLPRKLANPYFCIRSDVLDDTQYIGGYESGQLYPVIATIPKSNDFGDYFVSLDSGLEFTFTRPKTITEIKTQICNPDQTLAQVDSSSSVIYKITRGMNPNRFNIVEQVLNEK